MDRRDFLKSLGLGGIALTLPKPLEVMAAKMADLEGPPIHTGLARFRDLAGVMVYDFSLSRIDPDPAFSNPDRYLDFVNAWEVHLAAHENSRDYVPILQGVPVNSLVRKEHDDPRCTKVLRSFNTNLLRKSLPSKSLMGTMLDVWVVPHGAAKYPLPSITVILHGEMVNRPDIPRLAREKHIDPSGRPVKAYVTLGQPLTLSAQVRSVRLERSRAIELGLVSPSDPFEAL
jgi:hypothetical protein